ncbi:hypothetical protein [Anatilimnocola floriformis]|uniref:hypothetical protein n=1 Tax=Anatilimnocola floriformis TaxID=2948575 RepID=UPI0020C2789B|nr:hypothetical protein [Anatilimnocola floriformis]
MKCNYVLTILVSLLSASAWCASPEQPAKVVKVARQELARNELQPADEADRLINECRAALQGLNRHFEQASSRDKSILNRLLDREALTEALQAARPDASRLLVLSKQFYAPREGLELDAVLQMRAALDRYLDSQLLTNDRLPEDLREERAIHIERIIELLANRELDHAALREEVAWLATLNQAQPLVAALQDEFQQPNLQFTISRNMLPAMAEKFQKQVERSHWSSNVILGNRVEGMSHFQGQLGGQPVAKQENALELALTGQLQSPHNTAYAGKFQIHSQGQTAIQAKTKVEWDGTKFTATPAQVAAQTTSALTGASVERRRLFPNSRLAGRIDNRIQSEVLSRASESLPQARQQASGLAATRIAESFNTEIKARMAEWNAQVQHYYTHPLVRVGMLPKSSASLNESHANLHFNIPGRSGIAARTAPDMNLRGDLNVHIHESAFPNLIERFAGGGIWDDEFFAYIQKEALGDNDVELRVRENSERWAVQFERLSPWSTRIDRDGVHFTLAIAAYWINGQERATPFTLHCTLAPVEEVGNEHGWQRVGDVNIEGDIASQDRAFLRQKFSGFFASRFHLDGLSSPAGGAWDYLSTVRLHKLKLADGWLGMEFRREQNSTDKVAAQ